MGAPPWFIAPPLAWTDTEVTLPKGESHHALRVLRITPPDVITVTNGRGRVARCAVSRVEDDRLVAEILESEDRRRAKPEVVVYQGAAKGHKVDDVIERLAELGVAEVWVYESQRSVVRWSADKVEKSRQRWEGVARSAAKQSRNAFTLQAGGGLSFAELVRRVAKEPFTVVLWEEASLPLRAALSGLTDRVALVIGPEGGLTREEAEALADAGSVLVSLGPTILRTENAPIVATSALLYHYGLIG